VEPIWVLKQAVLAFHDESLAEHGGPSGVRDIGLLESALARPQNLLAYSEEEPSLCRLAAAYAYGIASNHPFFDGNKRTAFITALTFLRLNGLRVTGEMTERYLIFYSLAEGSVTEPQLAAWFEINTAPVLQ
jgi:death-on-curing protein